MKLSQSFSGPLRKRNVRGYVTQCKICGESVFQDEPRVWLASPMGISHERCVRDV